MKLLFKWWWCIDQRKGMWQSIVSSKYIRNMSIAIVTVKAYDSACWKDLMKVKHVYLAGRCGLVKSERDIRFWEDEWHNGSPLYAVYPELYLLYDFKDAIWKSRNSVCFEKRILHSPTTVVFLMCSFLQYWTELQKNQALKQAMLCCWDCTTNGAAAEKAPGWAATIGWDV
ncbi:hypothetical protein BRADI_2g31042v3 [Brachypodium distachyon]|uniref:Reverse transcriptase zinc-binding domain-containing protein n=1 Tax=Brachypodium distachyon TaxID=15368 RepID=A0A2K2DBA2_BRADI|nr:hypothetical protein BRADI_2g31042v3 [Brachypodium distachyon]